MADTLPGGPSGTTRGSVHALGQFVKPQAAFSPDWTDAVTPFMIERFKVENPRRAARLTPIVSTT